MFYYLYQITNKVNGKIYVGVHKTKNLNDGYMGSGKIIRSAIVKHGISNFSKVILETFENAEAMYAREAEIVTDEFLIREDTYNLRRGGHGGFDYINSQDWANGIRRLNGLKSKNLIPYYNQKPFNSETSLKAVVSRKNKAIENNISYNESLKGKKRSSEAKQRMSESGLGSKNSQFGTMWITNGLINSKIKNTDNIPSGWRKGRIMV